MTHDDQQLSATAEDYVKVVWNATEWHDAPATTTMLADRMGVSKATVSENVRKLCDRGLLEHAPYGAIALTDAGTRHALAMVRRHRLLETFLVTQLGYGWDEVHDEAEVLEHACSDRMIDAIDRTLGHPDRDPHGDPIPRPDGTMARPSAVSLDAAGPGRWRVVRISDADPDHLRTFEAGGLVLDARLTVEARGPSRGTIVNVVGRAAPLTLSAAESAAVWVENAS